MTTLDTEISRLLAENRSLTQDLKQSQADKDFVWSLWKKLQVANPDVTQAVSLVVQREREKAELRDRKVLEILQMKDDKIEELTLRVSEKTRELGESTIRRADIHEDLSRLQREVDKLRDRNATLELQARSVEDRAHSTEQSLRKSALDSEADKKELLQKIKSLGSELEQIRTEKADELALRIQMENKVRVLDIEVSQKVSKFEELVRELEEARSLLRRFESQARQQQQDLEYKNHELEVVRKELAELWTTHNQLTEHSGQQADLIRQIQSIQTDTQKMLKNQEEAYVMESSSLQRMYTELTGRYDKAKQTETELRQNILKLKKELLDRDDIISDLQQGLDKEKGIRRSQDVRGTYSGSFLGEDQVEPVVDMEYKVRSMQREIDNLHSKLEEKDRHIEELQEDVVNQTIEFDVARLNRHERTHSTPARQFRSVAVSPMKVNTASVSHRSRSVSPTRRQKEPLNNRYQLQKDLEDSKTILKLKVRELAELKKAHNKRLERLKSVQENYKNVKEQLKTLEAEYYGGKKKQKKLKRADPKDLRHEDSDGVWNELAYFKNENRTLVLERMTLEEELDSLRVQSSQDAATIHELKISLEQEREERAYEKKKSERETQDRDTRLSEITLLKSEVQNKQVIQERLEEDLKSVREDRDMLVEEKRILKSEIMELKKEASQHRMDTADLKRDIQRIKRELEEEKAVSRIAANSGKTSSTSPNNSGSPTGKSGKASRVCKKGSAFFKNSGSVTRKYKQSLNSSMKEMREAFDGGFEEEEEEDWEEMSEESDDNNEGDDVAIERLLMRRLKHRRTRSADPSDIKIKRSPIMKQSARSASASAKHVQRLQMSPLKNVRPNSERREVMSGTLGDVVTQTVLRDAGTSPTSLPAKETSNGVRRTNTLALRQLKPMKQRVGYLQQQVVTLRDSRATALKALEEQKETNSQLQADLNLANQRLRMSKQNIQKLTHDLDKVNLEKTDLEARLRAEGGAGDHSERTDHEIKVLEARLKSSSNELTRQNNVVRQLKQENETSQEQIRIMQDKMNRMERDLNQKRALLEDQRSRMRTTLENAKTDAESLLGVEMKVKLLQDTNDKNKVQIESYKKRLAAITREKREYEDKFLRVSAEIDKKNALVLESQGRKMELESALAEMERTAKQQLTSLAHESEAAIDAAQQKLTEVQLRVQRYQYFVRSLSQELLRRVQQARFIAKEESAKKSVMDKTNSSMKRAQDLAKNILNISQSELDDIMSLDGDSAKLESELDAQRRRDKKWVKKLERAQQGKEDFALTLVELFVQKIEERNELTARLHATRADQSPSENSKISNS